MWGWSGCVYVVKSTNADITGIDISNDCINVANSKHRHKNLNFILADVFKWVPDKNMMYYFIQCFRAF